jgi:hypothetical protein
MSTKIFRTFSLVKQGSIARALQLHVDGEISCVSKAVLSDVSDVDNAVADVASIKERLLNNRNKHFVLVALEVGDE